jgi:hypothetical protein
MIMLTMTTIYTNLSFEKNSACARHFPPNRACDRHTLSANSFYSIKHMVFKYLAEFYTRDAQKRALFS